MRAAVCLATLALVFAVTGSAEACRVLKLKNDTGQTVNDLHFETNKGNYDPTFSDLADGGTVTATLTASPNCQDIKIKKWWWTKDGAVVGTKKDGEPKCVVSINGPGANGTGQIRVHVHGLDHFFQTTPGDPPTLTNLKFKNFLGTITDGSRPLITVSDTSPPNTVTFVGNDIGDPINEMSAQLTVPDGTQNIVVSMGFVVPALGVMGLGVLALALAAISALVLMRRRRGLDAA